MTVNVLIVDDSGFFRRRVADILNTTKDLSVVGSASNGKEAIELVEKLRPDVITMDYEMPVMDGISAVKAIMARFPTPILMFSSLTHEGARITLSALEAGAVDYLPKNFEEISSDASQLQELLKKRIIQVAKSSVGRNQGFGSPPPAKPKKALSGTSGRLKGLAGKKINESREFTYDKQVVAHEHDEQKIAAPSGQKVPKESYKCVLIGASTGGPLALQKVLSKLPGNFPAPIVLVQHMPASFTPAFAKRLDGLCNISVKEAKEGDSLQAGVALLAPGGLQMMLDSHGKIRTLQGDERLSYKPSLDVTFGSAARLFPGKTLGVVMTGMGADGKEGCRLMKKTGSKIWSQDQKSSVIYGMPMAVANAGLSDYILNLNDIGDNLANGVI